MFNFKNIFYTLIIIISSNGLAGTIDPINDDIEYINYSKTFPSVIRIAGEYDGVIFQASSIAIDHKHVLTAAHVVKKASNCYIISQNKVINITKIICHKDFKEEIFGFADIAICECETDIGLDSYPVLYENRDEEGKIASICGLGIAGKFNSTTKISDNQKRAGLNLIEYIQDELLVCNASNQFDRTKTNLEFIIAHGDSGGGLFIDNKLAGVNSCVMAADKKPDSSYGDESCHTRISTYIPWIRENINNEK